MFEVLMVGLSISVSDQLLGSSSSVNGGKLLELWIAITMGVLQLHSPLAVPLLLL